MSDRQHLITLQEIDTSIDALRGRLDRLPEREGLRAAQAVAADLRARADAALAESEAATAEMDAVEAETAAIDAHTTRLQAQMKTVIAPREAEALQREIATLAGQRNELDDRGLDLLERIGAAEDDRARAQAEVPTADAGVADAQSALDAAAAALQAEIDALESQRGAAVAVAPAALVSTYDTMRRQHGGAAVARLVGLQCTGCHLELSRAEAETVRHVPDDQLPDCPSCGRVLLP